MSVDQNIYRLHPDTAALVGEIQLAKYMRPGELKWASALWRVAQALFPGDETRMVALQEALDQRGACPAGRVLAGAGSGNSVTWWNCFVAPLLQDSLRTITGQPGLGIMDALASVAYSMQMGGGVGTDFSPLRPMGALVRGVMASASGPLSYMVLWDAMCRTIMSAGYRRGAMMATLRCDHPDLLAFITAKHDPAALRMFNVSVLVTHAFMRAKEEGALWDLGHWEPPFDRSKVVDTLERAGREWFVYARLPARQIWQTLMESTYRYAEPGVIFIDRVNELNNLWYCEDIQCTNPCGEQPLSPDQNCNLSHVNLSRCVEGVPFSDDCFLNISKIEHTTRLLVRMSDNVVDLSPVPTEAQRAEAQAKRRIGLGITGLANALMFLRQRYGSPEAVRVTEAVMGVIRDASYRESIEIAKERGPFPAFERDKYLKGKFIQTLPEDIRDGIAQHGIRNALLNTVAPTGTVSIAQADNSSGGLEPVFLPRYRRKVLQPDNSFKESTIEDFGFRVYANVLFDGDFDRALAGPLPDYMCTTADLTLEDHLLTQAAVQKYIDSSVSKTINVPTDTPFEAFVGIYDRAYALGCKGCTTYREVPETGRGAVLTAVGTKPILAPAAAHPPLRTRPEVLEGRTRRLRWAGLPYPMFLTINDEVLPDGRRVPFEMFVNSKAVDYSHWVTAVTRLASAIMRRGGDLSFLPDELKAVWSARGGEFIDRRFVPSEVALIGYALEQHFVDIGYINPLPKLSAEDSVIGRECPSCGAHQLIRVEGCDRCLACDYNRCG